MCFSFSSSFMPLRSPNMLCCYLIPPFIYVVLHFFLFFLS